MPQPSDRSVSPISGTDLAGGGTATSEPLDSAVGIGRQREPSEIHEADRLADVEVVFHPGGIAIDEPDIPDGWSPPPRPAVLRHPLRFLWWCLQMAVGMVSLFLLLAVLAAIPIVNFVALGMLVDAEGRVARSGRLRDGFPLVGVAGRLGIVLLGSWLCLLPLRLMAFLRNEAAIVSETGRPAVYLDLLVALLAGVTTLHLCLALGGGGKLSCFFRPLRNLRRFRIRLREGDFWNQSAERLLGLLKRLNWRYHFWLGLRAFLGAFVWLLIPTLLLATMSDTKGPTALVSILGGILLVPVLIWVPLMQARFAVGQRMRLFWDWRAARELTRRSPIRWGLTCVVVLLLTLPLYLGKIRLPPRDIVWLLTAIFIASIYPARLLTGWSYARLVRKSDVAGRWRLWSVRVVLIPLLLVYSFLVFMTQAISEHGKLALFEHHAFLLPVPF